MKKIIGTLSGKTNWKPTLGYQARIKADKISPFNQLPGFERLDLSVQGDANNYKIDGSVYVYADNIPPSEVALAIDGDLSNIKKADFTLKTLGGIIQVGVKGKLKPLDIEATATADGIQPQRFYPEMQGTINNMLRLTAKQDGDNLSAKAVIERLSGTLQGLTLLIASALLTLSGCASKIYTLTDNVSLYPVNESAQKWGVITFYSQRQSSALPSRIGFILPNNQSMSGQITYFKNTATITSKDSHFFDNLRIGVGVGRRFGNNGSLVFGMPSPSRRTYRRTYRSDTEKVHINGYSDEVSLNCEGEFNRRQSLGNIKCLLTNGMQYSGTIRRIIAPSASTKAYKPQR